MVAERSERFRDSCRRAFANCIRVADLRVAFRVGPLTGGALNESLSSHIS